MALDHDIATVTKTANKAVNNISCAIQLHTKDKDYVIKHLISVDIKKDYVRSHADIIVVQAEVPMGDYMFDIDPYLHNLEATLSIAGARAYEHTHRFKCVLTNNSKGARNTMYGNTTKDELNKLGMATLQLTLLQREMEAIRTLYVDGIFSYEDVGKVIQSQWKEKIKDVKIEGKELELEVDMIKPNNTRTYQHICIPTGTELLDLGNKLQTKEYGVYNGDIGTYLTHFNNKYYVYVYPLYDPLQYDNAKRRLTILKAQNPALDYNENTYKVDEEGNITIVADSRTVFKDTGENEMIANGVELIQVYSDVCSYRDVAVSDKGGTAEAKVVADNHMRVQTPGKREDGVLKPAYVGNSDNMYMQRSRIISQMMQTVVVHWNFANPIALTPGMPTCFKVQSDGEIKEYKGMLLGAQYLYSKTNNTFTAKLVLSVLKSNISVTPDSETPQEQQQEQSKSPSLPLFASNTGYNPPSAPGANSSSRGSMSASTPYSNSTSNSNTTMSNSITQVASNISTVTTRVNQGINSINNVANQFTNTINNTTNAITGLPSDVIGTGVGLINTGINTVTGFGNGIINGVSSVAGNAIGKVFNEDGRAATNIISTGLSNITKIGVDSLANKALTKISGIF